MKIISAALAAAALLAGSGVAHADNYLTPGEESVGDSMSAAVCEYIDQNGVTRSSVLTMGRVIYDQPEIANMGDVVDVINYIVATYCPQHWNELVSFGEGIRGA